MTALKGRGRPRAANDFNSLRTYEPDASLASYARTAKAEFLYLPAHLQHEKRNQVKAILASERRQKRNIPSPLARIAFEVYGVQVDWLRLDQQVLSKETIERLQAGQAQAPASLEARAEQALEQALREVEQLEVQP